MSSLRIMRLMSNFGWSMPAPTMTNMPPRASWQNPASMAARCPEHSRTTWTARDDMRSGSQGGNTSRSSGSTMEVTPRSAANWRRPFVRLHHRDVRDPHGVQRGHAQRADRAGAEDHHAVAGRHARAGDAVQRHRERLGQRGMAGGQALREAQDAAGPAEDVLGEGAVRLLGGHAVAVLALGRFALQAATAGAAPRAGTAHDELADRPVRDVVADGGDGAAPFVAGHGARREAPPVAQLMDVGPADAARVHADDELVRPRAGDRALLHRDDAG